MTILPPRTLAVAKHEARLIRRDPVPLVIVVGLPLAAVTFVKPLFRMALHAEGLLNANGAEQAIPAMSVMFGFFVVNFIGTSFFREHRWQTWKRLRGIAIRPAELVVGKLLPWFVVAIVQQAVLFGVGGPMLGLHLAIGWRFVLLASALAACQAAIGFALAVVCRTENQMQSLSTVLVIVSSGVGGCLAPVELLPAWARTVAPATPTYWALRGFRSLLVPEPSTSIIAPGLALWTYALGCAVIGALLFNVERPKYS